MNLPNHENLQRRLRDGFLTATREQVPGCGLSETRFYHFIHRQNADMLWQLAGLQRRG